MPTVSVIIPTFNRGRLLDRAVQSVLRQTYRDFELIIVDDASSDNTEEIIRGYRDPRIKFLRHERNCGGAAARNTGIKAARGSFIAFQDSDDEWMKEKLELQMKVFETAGEDVGVVYSGFWSVMGNRKTYIPAPGIRHKEGNIQHQLLWGNFITTQVAVVRRECFEKAGMFDAEMPRLQDWELWLRISRYYKFRIIDKPLAIQYLQKDSITVSKNVIAALTLIIKKNHQVLKHNRKPASFLYFCLGKEFIFHEQGAKARCAFVQAFLNYPLNLKTCLYFFLSFFKLPGYLKVRKAYRHFFSRAGAHSTAG